ncbi:laccase-3-like isoform X2 [Pecten maximus]|uniref:laccase-3-like isoform X2 n=1 Tax=Pecten maximus TaxID=6579 RepID=UPI001458C91F|nr:laccase-3-like isoform X2 [Pecten maximus]
MYFPRQTYRYTMEHERILMALLFLMMITIENVICFECEKEAVVCETTLVIHHKLTMMHDVHRKVYPYMGRLYKFDVINPDQSLDVPMSEVITADGWEQERLVTVANASLPGPPIIVYEGQRLKVNVINELQSDTVTIHWHGLPQYNTPWMDGVAFVSQCPILPGQSFTYDFIAEPKGTYWYHSHVGSQRTKGLNGALIVRERNPTLNVPEHIITVQGWNHDWDSDMDHQKMVYGIFENTTLLQTSKSLDGTFFSRFKLTSALINGRGRYYYDMESDKHNNAPLEVFSVTHMKQYRFRVINVGGLYPFRVSVDDHNITLIASDGYDFVPEAAQSFIISPGERYDFILDANQPIGNYWFRAESLELDNMHKALAILRYSTATLEEPSSSKQQCTSTSECIVINCPFTFFPSSDYTQCKHFGHLKSATNDDPAPASTGVDGDFKEYFLNFAFPGTTVTPGSVNGRKFKNPQVSALTQPQEIETTCDKADCGEERICECTYSLPIKHNDVVQFVFLNMGKGRGWAHPIHLHGYSFYVVKMGYPSYNETTGQYLSQNSDIDCRGAGNQDKSFCNDATWSDPNWLGGNVPDVELANAPRKDTIMIPSGGYAVVRIKADNPGVWIIHCHIEVHSTDGMAMLINSSYGIHPTTPKGFPQCRGFPSNIGENQEKIQPEVTTPDSSPDVTARRNTEDEGYTMKMFWVTVAVLGIVMLLMMAYILHLRKEVKTLKTSTSNTQSTENLGVSVTNVAFKA